MHMQPVFEGMEFVSAAESAVNEDIFARGLCLPSDNKITEEEQTKVIELIRRCFG
jgi:dTDP-4-amino-4,6-dideoxygalactose transaminase